MKRCLLAIMIFLCANSVYASYYPLKTNSNTDIFVVPGSEDDLYLKHQILSRAEHSIEMITHLQTMGPVGGLVVDDLRKAMGRGVKVKYLFEAVATMTGGGDFGLKSIPYLTDERLYKKSGSELIVNRVAQRWSSPFAMNDLIHKKILIVDRGTPNEIIVITGRNNHEVNFKWTDLTFVVKRVNSNMPYLGDDIIADFDKTWALIKTYFKSEEATVASKVDMEEYAKYKFRPVRPTQLGIDTDNLIKQETRSGDALASNQFRPHAARIVTTDTLEQIAKLKLPKTMGLRKQIVDDVSNYFNEALKSAVKADGNIYALLIPAALRDSLIKMAQRNGEITILTNSSASLGSALPLTTVTDALESYATETLEKVASSSSDKQGDRVKMFSFVPQGSAEDPIALTATHRKMWVLEFANGQKLSFFGSHNLTTASSSKSDEIMIAAVDQRMADYFLAMNRQEIVSHYARVKKGQDKSQKTINRVTRKMGDELFHSIY